MLWVLNGDLKISYWSNIRENTQAVCQWVWCKILLDLFAFPHRALHRQPANEFYASQMLKHGGSSFTVEPVPHENGPLTKVAADFVMPHRPLPHAQLSHLLSSGQ